MWLTRKRIVWLLSATGGLALLVAVAVAGSSWIIHRAAAPHIFNTVAEVSVNDVGLVLGTSKFATGGHSPNPHFENRMDAAAALYRAGRVRHLLLSGDNGTRGYDEPADMKAALLARGVPAEAMTLDDAGFRTLDSVVRAKEVFGQRRLTIITDRFHAYRAVFLAQHEGIDAVAFPSASVDPFVAAKSRTREMFADVKACLDLYVLHTQPRFRGPPINIRIAAR